MLLVGALAFLAAAIAAFTLIGTVATRGRLRRRYGGIAPEIAEGRAGPAGTPRAAWFDPARLGIDAAAQRSLREELVRAGFFGPGAVAGLVAIRFGLLLVLPAAGLLIAATAAPPTFGFTERTALGGVLAMIGWVLPKAYLSRRQRHLETAYRLRFPDFVDMLVVCVNAGLSLEASLARATGELRRDDAAFRTNLELMAGEMRAGKSTGDALLALARRLGLPEARAFAGLLRQTIELGTDVAQALTIFSDEIRSKRMALAEERAAALPPKLTVPLGLFIFPVVLIVILAPAVVRILAATGS